MVCKIFTNFSQPAFPFQNKFPSGKRTIHFLFLSSNADISWFFKLRTVDFPWKIKKNKRNKWMKWKHMDTVHVRCQNSNNNIYKLPKTEIRQRGFGKQTQEATTSCRKTWQHWNRPWPFCELPKCCKAKTCRIRSNGWTTKDTLNLAVLKYPLLIQ